MRDAKDDGRCWSRAVQLAGDEDVIQIGAGGLKDQMLHGSGNGASRTSNKVGACPTLCRAGSVALDCCLRPIRPGSTEYGVPC
jgi:hypothetical protein